MKDDNFIEIANLMMHQNYSPRNRWQFRDTPEEYLENETFNILWRLMNSLRPSYSFFQTFILLRSPKL